MEPMDTATSQNMKAPLTNFAFIKKIQIILVLLVLFTIFISQIRSFAVTSGYGCGNFGTGNFSQDCTTEINSTNISNSTNCISTTLNVTIGNNFSCTFPLTGNTTTYTYSLPPNNIFATSFSTATGLSQACTIQNNSTPQVTLLCSGIISLSQTQGIKNISLYINNLTTNIQKGSVTFVITSTPLTNQDFSNPNLNLGLFCSPTKTSATTTCFFNLPADKTLPTNFQLSIGSGTLNGQCTLEIQTRQVICVGIPSGPQPGNQRIYLYFDNLQSPTDKTVNVESANFYTTLTQNPIFTTISSALIRTGGSLKSEFSSLIPVIAIILFVISIYLMRKK
jgi:hypothetical protein